MAEATKVADALVEYLSFKGVRYIFGILAHTSFEIGDAVARRPNLRFINSQHEGGAGNIALGYARATKKPAVCLVSAGGGATNIATAVAQAYKESVPLFVVSSEIKTAAAVKGAWSSWHGIDHASLFKPITKQAFKLERAEDLGAVLDSLWSQTTRGRPGPVYLGVPVDLQSAVTPAPAVAETAEPNPPAIDSRAAERIAELLFSADLPVVLAGMGVYWSGAERELEEIADLLGSPVATSYTAKGVFRENHPLALGCLAAGGRPYARKFFLEADLILALGTTFSEGTTLGFGRRVIAENAKIIQIDIDPYELGRNYPSYFALHADIKSALRSVIAALKERKARRLSVRAGERAAEIRDAKRSWQRERDQQIEGGRITKDSVLKALNDLLTEKTTLVTAGMTGDLLRNVDAPSPVVHAGEFRAIGTALATALGVKLGSPDARVVCVTGDGSFMMEQQELATARLHQIPVMVLVLRNNAYGGMKRDQIEHYDGRVIGTELFVPDLARLAELFGARGLTVARAEEVRPALEAALAADDLVLLDVKLDG
ncbi:MAG TPA: thiamine pyrophosphate-binding protein [Candidatus Acidoferrales bacterium]|nr:thiamine pyrophosphate-binding protein [Candidatus Acidoferrales bacterium]